MTLEDNIAQNACATCKTRFHGAAIAARMRAFYLKTGWIEE